MRKGLGGSVLLGCLLPALCACAFALDPSLDVSQYAHTSWRIRDGFPNAPVDAVAQTPDGYLWIGTQAGLFRFDGVRAVPWHPPPDQRLPSEIVASLLVARDGTLWIGTYAGLAGWKDGKLREYSELAGLAVLSLNEDREGTLWAGAFAYTPPGKLCSIQNGNVHCSAEGDMLGNGPTGLYLDSKGVLWAGVLNGLWHWKPGPPKFFVFPGQPNGVQALLEDADGSLLIGLEGRIARLLGERTETAYPLPGAARQSHCFRLLRDHDGGLWAGALEHGLVHIRPGNSESFGTSDGLSGDVVNALFEDREGNIWVGTNGGLDRFRNLAVPTYSEPQGLSSTPNGAILAASDGSIWIAARDVLSRWKNGQITVYRGERAVSQPQTAARERVTIVTGLPRHEFASLFEVGGRLWIAGNGGTGYLKDDHFTSIADFPAGIVSSIAGDGRGNLWLAHLDRGLIHLQQDRVVEQVPWVKLGRKDNALALVADTSGGVWLGFFQGGVTYFSGGRVQRQYTSKDGLGKGAVSALRLEPDGTLWAATEGGLSRLRDGSIATLNKKNGLPCDTVMWVLKDDTRSLWMGMPCGVVRIARSEVEAWEGAADSNHTIQTTVFDNLDGVRLVWASLGNGSPRATRSRDGKLWFAANDGIGVVDPQHLAFNKVPPPVHVEQITADGKSYDPNAGLRLPPLVRDLTIDYTALTLVVPEKVHFRFRLEGQDPDWREVVDGRKVQYSNLAPGNYRFRVAACNNSGVWNEEGTFVDFSVAPAYYQTHWFRASCVVALFLSLWGLYQLRLRRVAQQFNKTLEARVGERNRIARELHDTLLQSFQGALLSFQAAVNLLPNRPQEAKERLEGAIEGAAKAVTEGRDAIQDLRSSTIEANDLAAALKTLAGEFAAGESNENAPVFGVEVEGTPRDLHPILRDDIFRIAGEALRNVFRHAQASRIEVNIRYDPERFLVRIRDDGRGIDQQIVTDKGRPGHWGLRGMHERAKLVGGNLEVWSKGDAGTEIELAIPAAIAYGKTNAGRRLWIFRRKTDGTNEEQS